MSKIAKAAADAMAQAAAKANLAPDEQTRKVLEAGKQMAGFGSGAYGDPARSLEDSFEKLNALVRGEPDKPLPLDFTLNKVRELRDHFMQMGAGAQAQRNAASRIAGGGAGDVVGQAQLEFSRLPEPLRGWLSSLAAGGMRQTISGAKGELNDKLKAAGIAGGGGGGARRGASSSCEAAFSGRYPFARGSRQEAPLADFGKFFAPGGILDQFFQANLRDFVDSGSTPWRQRSAGGQSLALSETAIRAFELAARIRDAFFSGGGQTPQVHFDLKPLDLDPNVDAFRLVIEGQEIVYRHGPQQVTRIQWPGPAAGSGVRMVFEMPDKRQVSRNKDGAWAWFRLLDDSSLQQGDGMDRFNLTFRAEGSTARFELRALSANNPFNLRELQSFRCPESL